MRLSAVTGIVLIIAAIVILVRGGTFTTRSDVLDVGGLRVSAEERHTVQPWLAGLALAAGAVLVFTGTRRRAT